MDVPGSSLFAGGSIHFDGLSIEPGEAGGVDEEAEAAEEEERRNQELQNVLKDAFDDLMDDEDDDGSMNHTGDPSFHPEKYPMSTPFIAGKERSLYEELEGQYDVPRMSDPGGGYHADSDDYHGDYGRDEPDGYHGDGAGYHGDGAGYHGDVYHSGDELERRGDGDEVTHGGGFLTLQPDETNAGLTEMVDTPRQHLDTSDSSAAHYRHCYTSPRGELGAAAAVAEDGGDGDADDASSGNMIEMGLRAHQQQERAADTGGDVLDPAKYVANKQKDYILARTSRDQLETLYEARGHEIGRLRADLERQRTEAAAELRACRHQATLATADGQGLQTSLQQARQLLVEKDDQLTNLKGEIESLRIQLKATEEAKKESTQRLSAAEVTVQSLQSELTELSRAETLSRSAERHQQLVDGLQRRHQQEVAAQQRELQAVSARLEAQTAAVAELRTQLEQSEAARHRQAAERGELINQLTAGLEAAQARCAQLVTAEPGQLRERLAREQQQREQLQLQLAAAQDQVSSLQRDLEACESVLRLGARDDTTADSGVQSAMTPTAAHSTPVSSRPPGSGTSEPSPFSLRRELMRAMENTRARREEVTRLRAELETAREQQRATADKLAERDAQLTERDAQLSAARDQAQQRPVQSSEEDQQRRRRLDELELQLATEQKQRRLLEDQLRKIKAEGEKVHKTAEELRRHLNEQLESADREKLEAVEEVRTACLRLHDDMMDKLRTEKIEEYETELGNLRNELTQAQEELTEVKELYVKMCQEKDQFEQETEAAAKAAAVERERAVKSALDHHYDLWYADWRRSQQTAVEQAVSAERLRHRREVTSGSTQTDSVPVAVPAAHADRPTQTSLAPATRDGAAQADDVQGAEQLDKLKKRLKRACLEKKRLEGETKELHDQMKQTAAEHEEKLKKERLEADRRLREARRRSSGTTLASPAPDSELVKTLRHELEDAHAQLRKLTEQACAEKDELITTYESRLREALEQDRRVAAAMATSQRRQLTAGQLTAECDGLRGELERLRTEHERQRDQSERAYQQSLASYRKLVEDNVAELGKAEEELRREAAASCQLLQEENARLIAESASLAESYDTLLAQRQQDRESFEQQVRQLAAESASRGDGALRSQLSELQARLQSADTETEQLRAQLRQAKDKLRNYHGYVKERERHYDGEFRRLEAEYRVAVGKMKEKVMLAREGAARARPVSRVVCTQTEVSGDELVRVLQDMAGFQKTVGQLRLELTQVVQRVSQPAPAPPPPAEQLSTYRSHTAERRPVPPGRPTDRVPPPAPVPARPDSGRLSSLGRPDSGADGCATVSRGVSPLLAADNPLASLERIRRDLNYIFPRGTAGSGGGRTESAEELLARLARLPHGMTPPSRDGEWLS